MIDIWVLVAHESDGSGTPTLLRAYHNELQAKIDMDMIHAAGSYRNIVVLKTKLVEDDKS